MQRTVYTESIERLKFVFSEFDNVLVAFSGGKDSTVCLELCYDYARQYSCIDKLAMYHLDYEAQYQMTTDFVTDAFSAFPEIKRKYWCCLPIQASCACRMDSATWEPWEESKKDIWVRPMPDSPYLVTVKKLGFEFTDGITDYDFQEQFCKEFAKKNGKTAVVIGIRSDESLNRWNTVNQEVRVNQYNGVKWTTKLDENTVNVYPIADWRVEDIWTYLGKYNKAYNRIYDLYYRAGLSINQMRVASPFHCCGTDTLKLYKVIDPQTWGKMVGRVNGVNFAGLYGGTTAMGWNNIKKPEHFTWKQYCEFLLSTLDEKTRSHYQEKLDTSIKFWKEKGGALSEEAIEELGKNYPIEFGTTNYSDKRAVKFTEYPDELPQITKNFKEFPSWKRMCICIIKNDYLCKYMGFSQTKEEIIRRRAAIEKYKGL